MRRSNLDTNLQPVDFAAVADFDNVNQQTFVVNGVNYSVISLPNTVLLFVR